MNRQKIVEVFWRSLNSESINEKNKYTKAMSCFFEQIGMAMIANSLPPPLIQGVLGGGVHGVAGNGLQKPSFQMWEKNGK